MTAEAEQNMRRMAEAARLLQEEINEAGMGPDHFLWKRLAEERDAEIVALRAQIGEERELKERWRRHASTMRDRNIKLMRQLLALGSDRAEQPEQQDDDQNGHD